MGIVKTFLRDYGYWHKSDLKRSAYRAYAAAQMGRLTGDWLSSQASIDHDIRAGIVPTRSRARDLSQNNEYAKAFLRAVKKNVVGSDGFALQVKSVDYVNNRPVLDKLANAIIEDAFWKWSQPNTATVTGQVSFRKEQELVIETAARDGEMFTQIVRGNVNRFGFSLRNIEPDYVDHNLNQDLGNSRFIRMGIEVDEWRRPVAYHVTKRKDSITDIYGAIPTSGGYYRVPASDIIHTFDPERADQTRGMSWMAPAMIALHNLKGYVEAAIINARIGASKMGFLQNGSGTEGEYNPPETVVDGSGNRTVEIMPGSIEDIGTRTFIPFDPKYPDQQFEPFVKAVLRGISSSLGISFASISNDLTEVNYSSIRAGLIEERETWKTIQSWFIESFLNRVFEEWLTEAILTKAINLPYSKIGKFNAPKWTGRKWAWVDPLKDVAANKEERAACLKSSTMIANESGRDLEDVYREIADEEALAKEYGLKPIYAKEDKGNEDQGTADDAEEGADAQNVQPRPVDGKGNGKDGRSRLLV